MGVSEGTFQVERAFKIGAGDLVLVGGTRYHPYSLRTVLWERLNATNVDIFLEVLDGDRIYIVDSVLGTGAKSYIFPNARIPEKLDLVPAQKIRFRVTGAVAGDNQSVAVTWAELGTP